MKKSVIGSAVVALTGPIGNMFSDSVFGLKWMDDVKTVKRKFPGGKVKDHAGICNFQ